MKKLHARTESLKAHIIKDQGCDEFCKAYCKNLRNNCCEAVYVSEDLHILSEICKNRRGRRSDSVCKTCFQQRRSTQNKKV